MQIFACEHQVHPPHSSHSVRLEQLYLSATSKKKSYIFTQILELDQDSLLIFEYLFSQDVLVLVILDIWNSIEWYHYQNTS